MTASPRMSQSEAVLCFPAGLRLRLFAASGQQEARSKSHVSRRPSANQCSLCCDSSWWCSVIGCLWRSVTISCFSVGWKNVFIDLFNRTLFTQELRFMTNSWICSLLHLPLLLLLHHPPPSSSTLLLLQAHCRSHLTVKRVKAVFMFQSLM